MKQILINGSIEPLWRQNARREADRFKAELVGASVSRRNFLAGAGSTILLEYVAQRRAIAQPLKRGGLAGASSASSSIASITNARTGAIYPYLPEALAAMRDGDTILLPAGTTYDYRGEIRHYSHWMNTNPYRSPFNRKNLYLGSISSGHGLCGGDYGAISGIGSANNGRALIAPSWGILARDFLTTDSEMFFEPSTPAESFPPKGIWTYANPNYNYGEFAYVTFNYKGISKENNSLTGVSGSRSAAIPAGTVITTWCGYENKAIFIPAGANPGWTLTNLELAYTAAGTANAIQQDASPPGGPYVGSVTVQHCYIHDCKQGPGLGYSGAGDVPTFTHFLDSEFCRNGGYDGQSHNMYIGHVGEFIMDNCYSHSTTGAWLVKTRAPLNIITYNQIRGERSDANSRNIDNAGMDIPNGGLTYLIGNIHQQSLRAGNQAINYAAEANFLGSSQGGAPNHLQELYVVNGTMVGPAIGSGYGAAKAPIKLNYIGINQPPLTKLGHSKGASLAARQYWVAATNNGARGGESVASPLKADIGSGSVYQLLDVPPNNLITVASPPQATGTAAWNCYMNYGDPLMHSTAPYPNPRVSANYFFWDAAHTRPVFAFTSGGTVISLTGTLAKGNNVITNVKELKGVASLAQLVTLTAYVDGVSTGLTVWDFNDAAGTITLLGNYTGANGSKTVTFGSWLACGFTYQTALGDSVNASNAGGYVANVESQYAWYDGAYKRHQGGGGLIFACWVQVDPGQRLIVNAPPSGPGWAIGVNFWAQRLRFAEDFATGPDDRGDAGGFTAKTKLNSSPIAFGRSWTSSPGLLSKAQTLQPFLYRQNASPIAFDTGFTEPQNGLVNHNPRQDKLQWFRRGAMNVNGLTLDAWFAIVPAGGLAKYEETIYLSSVLACVGSVSIWRGCAQDPFDANFSMPVAAQRNGTSISTAAGNVSVVAAFRSSIYNRVGTAGPGFAQLASSLPLNTQYASSASPQSAFSVAQTNGSAGDIMMVDALVGKNAPPRLIGKTEVKATGGRINFTLPAADVGDVLMLFLGSGRAMAVGRLHGPPPLGNGVGASTLCVIKNCISVNYDNRYTSGSLACNGDNAGFAANTNVGVVNPVTGDVVPATYLTESNNLRVNPYNGSTFGTPSFTTVFADIDQTHFDYRLAKASPAKNAAIDPGQSPRGQDLVPHYQSNWQGSPTDGAPIPEKAARSDVGSGKSGAIGALS